MIFILIGSAALSLLIVAAGIAILGREALSFVRTAKKFQQRIEPMVSRLMYGVEVIQNRVFTVMDRSQLLQRRLYLLTIAVRPMKILITAWQQTMLPVNRIRNYVGL